MFSWITFVHCLNWGTVRKTIACIIQKRLTGLAAEMAFHAVLGLFPAIIAILTAVSLFERSVELILIDLAIRILWPGKSLLCFHFAINCQRLRDRHSEEFCYQENRTGMPEG